jgi:type IV pilus assembly protein PilX
MTSHSKMNLRSKQTGAALVVGLILLMVLTVLAISGMSTSALELQMAGNTQFGSDAFNQAERGIEAAIKTPTPPPPLAPTTTPLRTLSHAEPTRPDSRYEVRIDHDLVTGQTLVPAGGDELGGGITAYHYEITSTGRSSRNGISVHVHSYYRKGAGSNNKF